MFALERGEYMKINTKKLRIAMVRKCMSTRELAEAVGCSYESIIQILSGRRNAPMKKLGEICKALEVDPETLID